MQQLPVVTEPAMLVASSVELVMACSKCKKTVEFAGMRSRVTVRSPDIIGDLDGHTVVATYRAECGAELEVRLSAGCLLGVVQRVPHGGDSSGLPTQASPTRPSSQAAHPHHADFHRG